MRHRLKNMQKEIGICRSCKAFILRRTERPIDAVPIKNRVHSHRSINRKAGATYEHVPMPTRKPSTDGERRVNRTKSCKS